MENHINDFRVDKKLTYKELAEIVNLNPSSVYFHCSGKRSISAESALLYEKNLGIPRHKLRPDLWPEPVNTPSKDYSG
jgi:DNA-binding transcriptional regulator YdaS (Cro superfamily)